MSPLCIHISYLERVARSGSGRESVRGLVGAMDAELSRPDWLATVQSGRKQVQSRVCTPSFRALYGFAPTYIVDMLHRHRTTRALRSADNNDLQVPSTSSRYGDRAFAASAQRLWNALPRELKIATCLTYFKRLLKTHLFRIAYEQ